VGEKDFISGWQCDGPSIAVEQAKEQWFEEVRNLKFPSSPATERMLGSEV
jgi:hypothetical protein